MKQSCTPACVVNISSLTKTPAFVVPSQLRIRLSWVNGVNAQKKDVATSCITAKSVFFQTFLRHPWYASLVGGLVLSCAGFAGRRQRELSAGIVAVAKLVLLCFILQK